MRSPGGGRYRGGVRSRRLAPLVFLVLVGLIYPAASSANHTTTSATVSARVKERRSADFWTVEISWAAECHGGSGHIVFNGELYLVNVDTGERIHAGGVVSTSGRRTFSGRRDSYVASRERAQHLKPELTIGCYQSFPQDGGPNSVVTGNGVTIPPAFGGVAAPAAVAVPAGATTAVAIRRRRLGAAAA